MESMSVSSSTFGDILDQLSLSTLRYHWQTVLTSTVVFAIIYEISRIFSPVLFPKTFQFFKGVSKCVGISQFLWILLMCFLSQISIMDQIGIFMLYQLYIV